MKKYLLLSFFILISFLISSELHASTLKIGVFDMQRVLTESRTAQRYRQEFLSNIELRGKPLVAKEEAIRKMEEKLKNEGPRMTPDDRRSLAEKIETEIKELRRQREDIDIELKKIDQNLTQKVMQELNKVIQDIAVKGNYDIIFERSAAGIVYVKNVHDITSKIIEAMK
ncbi:MAG: OmpH family outer membrane protein [Syntrophorhabdaceae bacterium]|nr:OmpH family outer membrane protein [Syntrophorhabdaceae bacterium]